ncbi:hypothetical protein Z517_06138 [Fonsecaea pedrosoi CBS 271.37]|uniref:Fungal N-terminal domain-containing protein n=1 Tax=Fonsecaea pedrosoi CBS 271.37 TaxID=1442368 RepID=A0A0D2DP69_9EURO|nr:uncharacterized protein Z517_06138 [Fonsecaea pedrosoi CBS 271.37]KIW79526.1 hypothetical protein Z517_06138 [Fonsecaea pedrosoi CBS 271.37]
MAEAVLGVVAGGAGLASLALQLFEVSQKLHELRANIRDAPVEMREILDEADLLRTILAEYLHLSGAADKTRLMPTLVQKQAVDQCLKVLEILRHMAQELESTMRTSSSRRVMTWAKVEAAFNRKRFVKLQSTLERAKSTLVLAILTNPTLKPCAPQREVVLQESTAEGPSEAAGLPCTTSFGLESFATKRRIANTSSSSWFAKYNIGIGNVYIRGKHSRDGAETTNSTAENGLKLSVSFASWMFNNLVAFMFDSRPQRFQLTLQINRLVPPDAEIFHLCAAGDTIGVGRSIAEGKSSASDVTYEGVTPLMVAAYYGHADVCRILLDAGADTTMTVLRGYCGRTTIQLTALHFVVGGMPLPEASVMALWDHVNPWNIYWEGSMTEFCWEDPQIVANSDTVRALVEHENICIEFGWSPVSCSADYIDEATHMGAGHLSQITPEDFQWLIAPERINLAGQELDFFYMSLMLMQCCIWHANLRRIYVVFSKITDLPTMATIDIIPGMTVLHCLLPRLPFVEDEHLNCLRIMLERLVQAGAIEMVEAMRPEQPLVFAARASIGCYVSRYGSWEPERAASALTTGLNLWLEILGRAQVNIGSYLIGQRKYITKEPIECGVLPQIVEEFPEHFLDRQWYVQLSCRKDTDSMDVHNSCGFRIKAQYYSVESTYPAPGGWPGDEAKGNQQTLQSVDDLWVYNSDDDSQLESNVWSDMIKTSTEDGNNGT